MIGVYYILLSQRYVFANVIEKRLCVDNWLSISGFLPTCCRVSGRQLPSRVIQNLAVLTHSAVALYSCCLSFPPTPTWALLTTDEVPSALPTSVWPGGFTINSWKNTDLIWEMSTSLIFSIRFIVGRFKHVKLECILWPHYFSKATCDFQITLLGSLGKVMINTDLRLSHAKYKFWDFKTELDWYI